MSTKQGKSKRWMTREQKLAALLRKAARTEKRKAARRQAQAIAASRNRVSPDAAPWAVACAKRAAIRHGVSGAA